MGDSLATTQQGTGFVPQNFAQLVEFAARASRANGFVPAAYQGKPDNTLAAFVAGAELGISPMRSLRVIHIVEGRVTIAADEMLALAHAHGVRFHWPETSAERATIAVSVPGVPDQTLTYTMADAQRAGLAGRGNWTKYPAAMLRARAASAAMRAFCPWVLGGGVYESTSDEIPMREAITVTATEPEPEREAPRLEASTRKKIDIAELDAPALVEYATAYREALANPTTEKRREARDRILARALELGVEEEIGAALAPPSAEESAHA